MVAEPQAQADVGAKTDPKAMDQSALIAEIERLRPLAELGRMAATVAHEVRNPLTGISANAEIIRESITDPDDLESIDMILQEVHRLSELVSDLLHYSREREARADHIDLNQEARAVVELLRSYAAEAGIILNYEGSGLALGDSQLTRQSLLNIVRNAIQACKCGGQVTIQIEQNSLSIRDQGGGVPEALQERLFEPFVTGRTRGLGLGASVARRCMQRQNGDVLLGETGPTGSVFIMQWPTSTH